MGEQRLVADRRHGGASLNPTGAMLRRCPECRFINLPTDRRCIVCRHELIPAPPIVHPPTRTATEAGALTLTFTGSAGEYFRIWIVNVCLTILTAGLFSAWAKVRKKRYLYSHTILDGTPFQYLAQPLPILRGRLIAATLFAIYYVSSHFVRPLLPSVLVIAVALAPWVIVRSGAFNARYSAFRNMTFRFEARYAEALAILPSWGLIASFLLASVIDLDKALLALAILVFGLLYPYWLKQRRRFFVRHMSFGSIKGEFSATGGQFFRIYVAAAGFLIAGFMVTGGLIGTAHGAVPNRQPWPILVLLPAYLAWLWSVAYVHARTTNLVWEHSRLGPLRFQSTLSTGDIACLYLTNTIAVIMSAGLLTAWAVVRTLKYRTDHMRVLLDGDLTAFQGDDRISIAAAGAELGEFFELDFAP